MIKKMTAEKQTVETQPSSKKNEEKIDQKSSGKTEKRKGQSDKSEKKAKAEIAELKDKYLRLYSEFENYRRRTAKEKLDLIGTANEDLMVAILPVIDDFERALKAADDGNSTPESLKEGVQLIFNKLKNVTEKGGLKLMETNPGDVFDSEIHDAITQIPAPDEKLKGKIVDTVEKGYYLNNKVIRFAKVVTGA